MSATLGADHIDHQNYESKAAGVERTLDALLRDYTELAELQKKAGKEHNNRLAINKLPPEILCAIFKTCVDSLRARRHRGVVSLSHVCSEWRAITLAFPGLWSIVDLSELPKRFVELFLDRAKDHLLTFQYCKPFNAAGHNDLLHSRLHHIKSLEIMEDSDYRPSRLNSLPFFDALSLLVSKPPGGSLLHLESFSWRSSQENRHRVSPKVLDLLLFAGQTPRLQHLMFYGIRMPWKRGFYSNLQTLEIQAIDFHAIIWRDEDICNVLLDCPQLRTLTLSGDDDSENGSIPISAHPAVPNGGIHLPQLEHLDLRLPLPFAAHILQSITAENVCEMETCAFASDLNVNIADAMAILDSRILSSPPFLSKPDLLEITYKWSERHCRMSIDVQAHEHTDKKDIYVRVDVSLVTHCRSNLSPTHSPIECLAHFYHGFMSTVAPSMPILREQCLKIPYIRSRGLDRSYATQFPPRVLLPCRTLHLIGSAVACIIYHHTTPNSIPAAEDCPTLETLYIEDVPLQLGKKEMQSIIDWCRCQSLLRVLNFQWVKFAMESREEWQATKQEIEALGIEVVCYHCSLVHEDSKSDSGGSEDDL